MEIKTKVETTSWSKICSLNIQMKILVFFLAIILSCQSAVETAGPIMNSDFNEVSVSNSDSNLLIHEIDLKNSDLKFYYKDERGENYGSLGNLKSWIEENKKELHFAMNAGMYKKIGVHKDCILRMEMKSAL